MQKADSVASALMEGTNGSTLTAGKKLVLGEPAVAELPAQPAIVPPPLTEDAIQQVVLTQPKITI